MRNRSSSDRYAPTIDLSSGRLLLVEGKDEINIFESLIRNVLGDGAAVQVIEVGGKDRFPAMLRAISAKALEFPDLCAIGVVRDSDDNPQGAFQSVASALRQVGYSAPDAHGMFSDAAPSVGVFIVPDGTERGAIETLCRRSVQDTPAGQCVEAYLGCLADNDANQSRNEDKSFAHAYLAALRDPLARVGEAARRNVWDFASPAFAGIVRFVRDLASRGA